MNQCVCDLFLICVDLRHRASEYANRHRAVRHLRAPQKSDLQAVGLCGRVAERDHPPAFGFERHPGAVDATAVANVCVNHVAQAAEGCIATQVESEFGHRDVVVNDDLDGDARHDSGYRPPMRVV